MRTHTHTHQSTYLPLMRDFLFEQMIKCSFGEMSGHNLTTYNEAFFSHSCALAEPRNDMQATLSSPLSLHACQNLVPVIIVGSPRTSPGFPYPLFSFPLLLLVPAASGPLRGQARCGCRKLSRVRRLCYSYCAGLGMALRLYGCGVVW